MLPAQVGDILQDRSQEAFGTFMVARRNRFRPSDDLAAGNHARFYAGPAKVDPDRDFRVHRDAGFPGLRFAIIRNPSKVRFG